MPPPRFGCGDAATDPAVSSAISALTVEPLKKQPDAAYFTEYLQRLQELTAARRIGAIKSKLQRTNPVEEPETFNRMFGELAALEAHRRALLDQLTGRAE